MRVRLNICAPLAIAAILLAGCGGGSDEPEFDASTSSERERPTPTSDDTSASTEPDTSDETTKPPAGSVGTDDFSFTPPDGWIDISYMDEVSQAEVAYASTEPVDGFSANINVLKTTGDPGLSISELEEAAVSDLESYGGFSSVTAHDPYDIDGIESPVITSVADQGGANYQTRQYYAVYDNNQYVITFSFSLSEDADEVVDIAESVIDSWVWSS